MREHFLILDSRSPISRGQVSPQGGHFVAGMTKGIKRIESHYRSHQQKSFRRDAERREFVHHSPRCACGLCACRRRVVRPSKCVARFWRFLTLYLHCRHERSEVVSWLVSGLLRLPWRTRNDKINQKAAREFSRASFFYGFLRSKFRFVHSKLGSTDSDLVW